VEPQEDFLFGQEGEEESVFGISAGCRDQQGQKTKESTEFNDVPAVPQQR
jgi:hypothetical protein